MNDERAANSPPPRDDNSPPPEQAVDVLTTPDARKYRAPSPPDSKSSESSSRDEIDCSPSSSALMTPSEGVPNDCNLPRPSSLPERLRSTTDSPSHSPSSIGRHRTVNNRGSYSVGTCVSVAVDDCDDEENLRVPIVGYEVMEQRAKFTVFKMQVRKSDRDNWLIFRRYTDFVRVNYKLKEIFPMFRLALPPKRWFGSNFDPNFLEDRQLGLQAFINNIIGHKDLVLSEPVREFLCLDDPPGAYDSIEESRALCESMDETVYNLRLELSERDAKIATLRAELAAAHRQMEQLNLNKCNVQTTIAVTSRHSSTPISDESSSTERDVHSRAEADQSFSFARPDVHDLSPVPRRVEDNEDSDSSKTSPSVLSHNCAVSHPDSTIDTPPPSGVNCDKDCNEHGQGTASSQSNIIKIT